MHYTVIFIVLKVTKILVAFVTLLELCIFVVQLVEKSVGPSLFTIWKLINIELSICMEK